MSPWGRRIGRSIMGKHNEAKPLRREGLCHQTRSSGTHHSSVKSEGSTRYKNMGVGCLWDMWWVAEQNSRTPPPPWGSDFGQLVALDTWMCLSSQDLQTRFRGREKDGGLIQNESHVRAVASDQEGKLSKKRWGAEKPRTLVRSKIECIWNKRGRDQNGQEIVAQI